MRQRHAVDDRAHAMLAHAEVEVAAVIAARLERAGAVDERLGRGREIGRSADQPGEPGGDRVQDLAAGIARGHALLVRREDGDVGVPALGELVRQHRVELLRQIGLGGAIGLAQRLPCGAERLAAFGDGAFEPLLHAVGDEELGILGPAIGLLGAADVVVGHRLAMRLGGALDRAAIADDRVNHDQGRPVVGALELRDRGGDGGGVVGIVHVDDVPAIGLEALADILVEGEIGAAFDRDVVRIVDPAEVGKLEVAGEAGRLGRDALHHAAVSGEAVDVVIEDGQAFAIVARGEPALGDRHADRIAAALAERAGGGLDAGRVAIFGVAGGLGADLAEILDVLQADRRIAGRIAVLVDLLDAREVEQRIEQHRGVADRQDEAVAVGASPGDRDRCAGISTRA